MKDLILISAYCPDNERKEILYNCINSIQNCRNDYDIIICSHTYIPEYILKKVDYVFYDRENELITDPNLINTPWFSPYEGYTIHSTYISNYSTYLAVYRLSISGFGIGKIFGYNKIHYIEYDSVFNNSLLNELNENSDILENHTAVLYKKEYRNFENNLDWGYGCLQSINLNRLSDTFLTYNKELLLSKLKNSANKTNEKISQETFYENNGSVFFKNLETLHEKGFELNLSQYTEKDSTDFWAVPYYDEKDGLLKLVVWNSKSDDPINVIFVINNDKIFTFNNIGKFNWSIQDVGKIEDVNEILIIVNDKIKNKIDLTKIGVDTFKKTNYVKYE